MKLNRLTIPFVLINFYLIFTFILFLSNTIYYPKVSNSKIVYFVVGYQVCFCVGYYLAIKNKSSFDTKKSNCFLTNKRILIICLFISVFFSLLSIVRISNSFNPIVIVKTLFNGIFNSGESYYYNLNLDPGNLIGGRFFTTLNTLLSPIIYSSYCLGIYYFNKFDYKIKILVVFSVILEFFVYFVKGTNIGVFRISIIVIVTFILVLLKNKVKICKKNLIIIALVFTIASSYFLVSISSRLSEKGYMPETVSNYKINYDAKILSIVPDKLKFTAVLAISYLSSGYQGLEYSLEENFTTTYGFGNSAFIMENIEEISGLDLSTRTYQYKIDDKWDARSQWHTAYTWWANDVSFYGVFLIMILLGYLSCLVLKDAYAGNLCAIILLPLYTLLILFIPANNVVLSNPLTCMPFVSFNILWFTSKIKKLKFFGSDKVRK